MQLVSCLLYNLHVELFNNEKENLNDNFFRAGEMDQQTTSVGVCNPRHQSQASTSHGGPEETDATSPSGMQDGTYQELTSGERNVRNEELQQGCPVRGSNEAGPLRVVC